MTGAKLDDYTYSEADGFTLSNEAEQRIREAHKFYLSKESEIKEYNRLQALCKSLNEHVQKFQIDSMDINIVAGRLRLSTVSTNRQYQFIPDLMNMKKYLMDKYTVR